MKIFSNDDPPVLLEDDEKNEMTCVKCPFYDVCTNDLKDLNDEVCDCLPDPFDDDVEYHDEDVADQEEWKEMSYNKRSEKSLEFHGSEYNRFRW
jgi:hypothetical protein